MKMLTVFLLLATVAVTAAASDERLVVHEWGTFTSLQTAHGQTLGGINTDDESLPEFVTTLGRDLIGVAGFKGVSYSHPDVTMRLETPVIYFHPQVNQRLPMTLDVDVEFKGGWLTQFYPNAVATAPGILGSSQRFGRLPPTTVSTLSWHGLNVGVNEPLPATKSNVWLAPRAVDSATVANSKGQAEKYLFYRGVGNIVAPLRVWRTGNPNGQLQIATQVDQSLANVGDMQVRALWLAHFKPDGTSAFQAITPEHFSLKHASWTNPDKGPTVNSEFSPGQYGKENTAALRKSMREALIADGLFADEADAMLNTWELSYFKSAGMRLFFIVPHAWTDHYLPLKISVPHGMCRA